MVGIIIKIIIAKVAKIVARVIDKKVISKISYNSLTS